MTLWVSQRIAHKMREKREICSKRKTKIARAQPTSKMRKALLKCFIDNRGVLVCCWFSFKHFEGEGRYHFSHSSSNPAAFKRKILVRSSSKRLKILYMRENQEMDCILIFNIPFAHDFSVRTILTKCHE